MESIENSVIRNLILNEEYTRRVLPFIKAEYFDNTCEKVLFEECSKFIQEYNKCATKEILNIECEKRKDCLLYTSPSPRDQRGSRMPSSA